MDLIHKNGTSSDTNNKIISQFKAIGSFGKPTEEEKDPNKFPEDIYYKFRQKHKVMSKSPKKQRNEDLMKINTVTT